MIKDIKQEKFGFKIIKKDSKSKARVGRITTVHGVIETPSFVAVGTQATVKGLSPKDIKEAGVQLLFGNTYHLHLRPGEDVVKKFGGVGKFMGWNGPTITDSGGFQIFSLGQKKIKILQEDEEANLVNIADDGVIFRSHIDGSKHTFTPEVSIEIQKKLGADIILAFDECVPHPSTHEYTKEAMQRTHHWAPRSLKAGQGKQFYPWKQALYGIIQGGIYKDLRQESAKFISALSFDGIAIGGVSVGESKKEMRDAIDWSMPFLPSEKPRHLLGIGEIDDIFDAIERGIDTFDCVIPTRFGRYGIVFVSPQEGNIKNRFRIDINKTIFAKDQSPIAKDCLCYTCQSFTRGYLHHLFRAQELLAYRLASYHNMFFINDLVKKIRKGILNDEFAKFKKQWLSL
ncbi:MAG: tRNA guanosine(34) transglycosylase Tgt [Candidatus Levybacteria bacterium]|nr:tRNA guanosine(34) transglycosylase Tgt [Candidatus Levybacteria bacterium]